jgi:hypothetical protein
MPETAGPVEYQEQFHESQSPLSFRSDFAKVRVASSSLVSRWSISAEQTAG